MSAARGATTGGATTGDGSLVSVVMPFLNAARFLAESVESVRAQTWPHWELLLCDDGATDGSTALARRYAALDPARIRLLAHADGGTRGASAARNLGLAAARGAYVAFLDADDVWLPHKLAEQVALLAAHPEADVLTGSTEFWHGWTGDPADAGRDRVVRIGPPHGSLLRAPTMLVQMLDGTAAVPCTCSIVARRAAVERAGGFEESFRRVFTDQAFYAKLFAESSLLVVDTCWDRYRQHDASSCATAERAGEMRLAQARYLAWLRALLDERGVRDRRVRSALRLAEWRVRNPRAAAATRRVRHAYYRAMRLLAAPLRRLGVARPRQAGA